MVTEGAQLYTIEGIAAGMIMLLTAFFVLNATAVYTPGDAHISDMQLEILGKDALDMMDTRYNGSVDKSPLQVMIENNEGDNFKVMFLNYTNNRTLAGPDHINFEANVSYLNRGSSFNPVESYPLVSSRKLTGGEHAVRATKWVIVNKRLPPGPFPPENRAVLVEVLLWRD